MGMGLFFCTEAKIRRIKRMFLKSYHLDASQIEYLEKKFQTLKNNFGAEVTFKIDKAELESTGLHDSKIQKIYLFYQSKSHQYLLNRYGIFAYITQVKPQKLGYRVSLFLICVRTNVDCQVVGTILCNKYTDHTKVLKEALTEFKEINEFWKPRYLMIDPSEAMVSAVEELFPSKLFFFH